MPVLKKNCNSLPTERASWKEFNTKFISLHILVAVEAAKAVEACSVGLLCLARLWAKNVIFFF